MVATRFTFPVPSNDTAVATTSPEISKFLAVASEVAVPAFPSKSASIALVKVATPVTLRSSSSVCPKTSRPPLASRRPPMVLIPATFRLLKSLGSNARSASRVAIVVASAV
jgi:hypothetical protein